MATHRYFPPRIIEWAKEISSPPFTPSERTRNPAYQRGIRYQRKVQEKLRELYDKLWVDGRWFQYKAEDSPKIRYCQIDGALRADKHIVLCEVKYNHCADAYFQLQNLYLPVVLAATQTKLPVALCEIVKWYDPSTSFPCGITLQPDLHKARPGAFSICIINR
jgi:hypothetical protein